MVLANIQQKSFARQLRNLRLLTNLHHFLFWADFLGKIIIRNFRWRWYGHFELALLSFLNWILSPFPFGVILRVRTINVKSARIIVFFACERLLFDGALVRLHEVFFGIFSERNRGSVRHVDSVQGLQLLNFCLFFMEFTIQLDDLFFELWIVNYNLR
jgi:hypothetical protein